VSGGPTRPAGLTIPSAHWLTAWLERALQTCNRVIMVAAAVALLGAALVLTESVVVRYFLKETTDWQDETCVMLLVGATFLSAAHVQSLRGHIGIEAVVGLLPPPVEHARELFVDIASLAFCSFFAWKSWTLAYDAWVDGTVTASTFAPPLCIPYATMAAGMTLLSVQIFAQLAASLTRKPTE